MVSGKQYKQGDIILVNFPFADRQMGKVRPALVISKEYNTFGNMTLVQITKSLRAYSDKGIVITDAELEKGTIKYTSTITVDNIMTLSPVIVSDIGRIAVLKDEVLQDVLRQVKQLC